jgi:hypothetical protein
VKGSAGSLIAAPQVGRLLAGSLVPTPSQRERRRQWARLIAKVFEVDPLRCSCGGTMRVIAFILDPKVMKKFLPRYAQLEKL